MNAEQFAEWRDDPRTVAFFQFLSDYRHSRMEMWATGAAGGFQEQEMAKCQLLHTLINLDNDAVSDFYRQKGSEHVPEDQATGR